MARWPSKAFYLSLVPLLFCSGAFAPAVHAQDKPLTPLEGEQATVGTPDNSSSFSRAVTAATKREQADNYWQTFQQSGDDDALEQSLTHLAEAIALAPDSKSTWQLAATIHYKLRNIPAFKLEAINSFEKLLQLDPQDLPSRVLLVDELMSLWRWKQAAIHLENSFSVNQAIAVDTVLDRLVISYLKAGWQERGAAFLEQQINSADSKEPLLIALAIMEQRSGQTEAAYASLGKVLFSNTATKAARTKARQLKTYWQENELVPEEEASK